MIFSPPVSDFKGLHGGTTPHYLRPTLKFAENPHAAPPQGFASKAVVSPLDSGAVVNRFRLRGLNSLNYRRARYQDNQLNTDLSSKSKAKSNCLSRHMRPGFACLNCMNRGIRYSEFFGNLLTRQPTGKGAPNLYDLSGLKFLGAKHLRNRNVID